MIEGRGHFEKCQQPRRNCKNMHAYQWPAVSYRYRIEKVSDTFFLVSRKVSEKFQSIGIVSGKNSKFQSRSDTF